MKKTVGIGFVGVGNISGIYLKNITHLFKEIEIIGVCDLVRAKAEKAQAEYGVHVYNDMYELFADERVDIVLNITEPNNHYGVTMAALRAGKHVYSEKPLATRLEDGYEIYKYATEHNLLVGGAPDTFMGAGIQTARKLIDDGAIGKVFGGNARFLGRGPEGWHPNPAFFYQHGGGPLFDIGPYYVTALINLFGRAHSVTAVCTKAYDERIALGKEHFGERLPVEVPTHVNAIIRFDSGAQATLTASFDTYDRDGGAPLEVYGTEGTLYIPDPNIFGGPVKLLRPGQKVMEVPLLFGYSENSRALGLADMAKALCTGRDYRACVMQQLHALEIMCSCYTSSDTHSEIILETEFERKPIMQYSFMPGVLED